MEVNKSLKSLKTLVIKMEILSDKVSTRESQELDSFYGMYSDFFKKCRSKTLVNMSAKLKGLLNDLEQLVTNSDMSEDQFYAAIVDALGCSDSYDFNELIGV